MVIVKKFGIWNVRIVFKGDRYGLNHCLVNDEKMPMVEFYDTYKKDESFGSIGQFVSRYNYDTLVDDRDHSYGLNLCGYEPAWSIDKVDMDVIISWLKTITFNCDGENTKRKLSEIIMLDCWDNGDKWGSAISEAFTIANELDYRQDNSIPGDWQYSKGTLAPEDTRDKDDYNFENNRYTSTSDLVYAGNVLMRYVRLCEKYGHSY